MPRAGFTRVPGEDEASSACALLAAFRVPAPGVTRLHEDLGHRLSNILAALAERKVGKQHCAEDKTLSVKTASLQSVLISSGRPQGSKEM